MSTDERPESLASQAAAWVPPWERPRPQEPAPDGDPPSHPDDAPADDAPADAQTGEVVPPELPPIPGEVAGPVTVDAPQILPGESEPAPTDVGVAPDVPVPDAIEAAEAQGGAEPGLPVDAPTTADGDDAGDVFDAAADDEVDLPLAGDEVDPPLAGDEVDPPLDSDDPAEDRVGSDDAGAARGPAADGTGDAGPGEPAVPGEPVRDRGIGDAGPPAVAARPRTPGKEPETLPPIDEAELRAALEAIMLVVDEPVGELQLAQIMEQPAERVAAVLQDIAAAYTAAGHGFDLRRAAGGWRLYTRPEYAAYVERFVLDGQSVRLTQAALETLAVVAYKQPVTRSRISVIRGVNCDGVMRTLVTRGLIEECGTETETGAFLYRTTTVFLEKLGLDSVDQLPPLAPFLPDDVEEVLDAQR